MVSNLTDIIDHKTPLIENNILLVFLNWNNCIKLPISGSYKHQNIKDIKSDILIFLGGRECSISTQKGYLHCLFGLGYYYTKFEIKSGNYVTDNRELTGIVISDFVYDYLATSKSITFGDDPDLIFTDLIVKVPIDLSSKSNTKKTFIKGTLMRNLFIPYKDVFIEMMEYIKKDDSYNIGKNGPTTLNTDWHNFNTILISNRMQEDKKKQYLNSTAGISQITTGADKYLNEMFDDSEIVQITNCVEELKEIYSSIDFDQSYLFSLIENASKYLSNPIRESEFLSNKSPYKKPILLSAAKRGNEYKDWPSDLRIKSEEEIKSKIRVDLEDKGNLKVEIRKNSSLNEDIESYSAPKEEDFILRNMRPQIVKEKKLPERSMDNIKEILQYLVDIINEDYDMPSIGRAFEIAHKKLREIALYVDYMWEMIKLANIYKKKNPNLGLSIKEKEELLRKILNWMNKSNTNQLNVGPK